MLSNSLGVFATVPTVPNDPNDPAALDATFNLDAPMLDPDGERVDGRQPVDSEPPLRLRLFTAG